MHPFARWRVRFLACIAEDAVHGLPRAAETVSWSAGRHVSERHLFTGRTRHRTSPVPTALDNGQRSPRKLLRATAARPLGRTPRNDGVPASRAGQIAQPRSDMQ